MMSGQAQSGRPMEYAPNKSDPPRLANVTIRAVDQLGAITAGEIEKTAEQVTAGAAEIADKLRELADAVRQHTEIVGKQVESFCAKATSVFEDIAEIKEKLGANRHKPEAENAEGENLPVPEFLTRRPDEISEDDPGTRTRSGRPSLARERG
jgi:chromosome segregation ATPase